jgi:hypothetical protein
VVEHVGPRRHHLFECAVLAQEVGGEDLDRRRRTLRPDRADHSSEVRSPAVVEVVAVDRGHDHMLEAERRRRRANAGWLGRIERSGIPV